MDSEVKLLDQFGEDRVVRAQSRNVIGSPLDWIEFIVCVLGGVSGRA